MATFRKRTDKWQARVQRAGFPDIAKTFTTRRDAEQWARMTESEIERGLYICSVEAQRTTLADALDRYEREISKAKKSHCVEKYYIKRWRTTKMASLALSSIRGVDVAQYRDARLNSGISTSSVRHELGLLSHLFTVASREWGMESLKNPVRAIRLPALAKGRERRVSDAEIEMICACVSTEVAVCIQLAVLTAMRRSELLQLRWSDIDLDKSVAVLRDTKNGDRRNVPLSSLARTQLQKLVRRKDGRVFSLAPSTVTHAFKMGVDAARKKYVGEGGMDAGWLVDLHFHDLRHEAASRLVTLGLHPLEIMAVTGHRDTSMLKRYVHPRVDELVRKLG